MSKFQERTLSKAPPYSLLSYDLIKMQEVLSPYLDLLISEILKPEQFPIISIVNSSHQLLISQLLTFPQSPLRTSLSLMQISYERADRF